MIIPQKYINDDGFVTIQADAAFVPGEGNGWLQTGLAEACGMSFELAQVARMLKRCRFDSADPRIWRSPHKKDPGDENQADDYYGAALLSTAWSKELLAWCRANGWNFDPYGKRPAFWFGRFVTLRPHIRLCAGEDLELVDRVLLASSIFFAAFTTSADTSMIAFCKVRAADRHSWLLTQACRWWRWRTKGEYGTIGASWAAYFGPDHPLSTYNEE